MDIRTLAIILGITHLMQVGVLVLQASLGRAYRGFGLWVSWSACAAGGFAFILLRQVSFMGRIAIIGQNGLLILAVLLLYAGVTRFLGSNESRALICAVYGLFLGALLSLTYWRDDITARSVLICGTFSGVSFLTARALLTARVRSVRATAAWLGGVFVLHGLLFIHRTIMIVLGAQVADIFSPSLFNVLPYLDGILVSLLWTFGLIIMVNQRLHAEMREAKEHFELLFNTSPDAVLITRASDGLCLEANPAFSTLSGYDRAEVLGRSSMELDMWLDPANRKALVAELRERGAFENRKLSFRRKDGSTVTGTMSAKVFVLNGESHILSVTRDVTEAERVEARRAELERERQRAAQAEAMGYLVQGLAHEIRNPLFSITANAQALQKRMTPEAETAPFLAHIVDHVMRLNFLMADLLELGRPWDTRPAEPSSLEEIAAAAAAEAGQGSPGREIRLSAPDGWGSVVCGRDDLVRALAHLLTNALQHAPPDEPVELVASRGQGKWLVRVVDRGPGVDPRILPNLFTPFMTGLPGRRGLGLALVKHYVERQGGRVDAHNNEPGPGATFTLILPLGPQPAVRFACSGLGARTGTRDDGGKASPGCQDRLGGIN